MSHQESLRDNPDGTCNCRPLGSGCFFTEGSGGRCACPCHTPEKASWEQSFEEKFGEDFFDLHYRFCTIVPGERQEGCAKNKKELQEKLKSFITSLLSSTRRETLEEMENKYENCPQCTGLREEFKRELRGKVEKMGVPQGKEEEFTFAVGYNQALQDLLDNLGDKRDGGGHGGGGRPDPNYPNPLGTFGAFGDKGGAG